MKVARVMGSAVSTAKVDNLAGSMLLIVQETSMEGEPTGEPFVAVDAAGAGRDELVLVVTGSAARALAGMEHRTTDALIVGILDSVSMGGEDVFRKS